MSAYDPLWEEGKSDLIDKIHELEDVAEFEARAAKKALFLFIDMYHHGDRSPEAIRYAEQWLEWVRCEAEEEMDRAD